MTLSRRNFLISTAFITGAFGAAGLAKPKTLPGTAAQAAWDVARLDGLVAGAVSAHATPGISLALWQDGKAIYSRTAGMANLETGASVVDASVFRIGSLSKQFSGALVLKLAAQGKLSLADPASSGTRLR